MGAGKRRFLILKVSDVFNGAVVEFSIFYNMKETSYYISLLSEFANKYAKQYGISRIGIFGSVARGEHKSDSDIDVYYEGNVHGLMSSLDLHGELEKLFDRKIDLVRKRSNMNKYLLERINREVIYV